MGRQTEDLSAQVDGSQTTFTTTFQRKVGTSVVYHNKEKVLESAFTEPNSKQIALGFVPVVDDEVFVVYFTDETVDGRVQGFSSDPTTIPPPAFPQGLQEILEDLDARIDDVESSVEQPADPKDSVQVSTLSDILATYDNVGGTGGNGSFSGAPLAVDGTTVETGFRVLVKNQFNADENGIYVVLAPGSGSDGSWERSPDFLTGSGTQVTEGARAFATRGTQTGRVFLLAAPDPVIVGGPSGSDLPWIVSGGPGGGGGSVFVHETIVPTLNQISFTLSQPPGVPADTELYVNQAKYTFGLHFTVSGVNLIWGTPSFVFSLDSNDFIEIVYSI